MANIVGREVGSKGDSEKPMEWVAGGSVVSHLLCLQILSLELVDTSSSISRRSGVLF